MELELPLHLPSTIKKGYIINEQPTGTKTKYKYLKHYNQAITKNYSYNKQETKGSNESVYGIASAGNGSPSSWHFEQDEETDRIWIKSQGRYDEFYLNPEYVIDHTDKDGNIFYRIDLVAIYIKGDNSFVTVLQSVIDNSMVGVSDGGKCAFHWGLLGITYDKTYNDYKFSISKPTFTYTAKNPEYSGNSNNVGQIPETITKTYDISFIYPHIPDCYGGFSTTATYEQKTQSYITLQQLVSTVVNPEKTIE